MRGHKKPPVEVSTAHIERLDDERLSIQLTGTWRDGAAGSGRLMLMVDGDRAGHRFPAVPQPRQVVGAAAARFEARFTVPAALQAELAGRMTLLVGDAPVALPPLQRFGDPSPRTTEDDAELLAPLREELAERARVEARLRVELAGLRARVDTRGPAAELLAAMRRQLADELERVRRTLEAREQHRREEESRATALAAELSEARRHHEALTAQLEVGREESDALRARVAELEAEATALKQEAHKLRTAELSARAGREAALAEVSALHDELDRLAVRDAAAEEGAAELELGRAEALLAEARALTESAD